MVLSCNYNNIKYIYNLPYFKENILGYYIWNIIIFIYAVSHIMMHIPYTLYNTHLITHNWYIKVANV